MFAVPGAKFCGIILFFAKIRFLIELMERSAAKVTGEEVLLFD